MGINSDSYPFMQSSLVSESPEAKAPARMAICSNSKLVYTKLYNFRKIGGKFPDVRTMGINLEIYLFMQSSLVSERPEARAPGRLSMSSSSWSMFRLS